MKRVLVANRGEIAVRIIRTLKKLNIESVAIYHSDETGSNHADSADHIINLGKGSLTETYLNIPKLISLAKDLHCDGIHPGYGFLSENHNFATACEVNNINFIGPASGVIRSMGLKSEAKELAQKAGIPVLEGQLVEDETKIYEKIKEYPVLIKAVAGGGGKGLKIVNHPEELELAIQSAKREAIQYFGDDSLMVEPYIENARHIEVQVLGDIHGNIVHLFERECSIQRNHQKIIEEAPAESISQELKEKMYNSAIQFAKELNYSSAGTVEFLFKDNCFWFLEMNTRIQVEHPVTEMITGVDLVEEQIKIAEGKIVSEKLRKLKIKGHAIEARMYSEMPFKDFCPSTGEITYCKFPSLARIDTFVSKGTYITPHFDSMLAKIIVHDEHRKNCIDKIIQSIEETIILGVETNLNYLIQVLKHQQYADNNISTSFLSDKFDELNLGFVNRSSKVEAENIIPAFIFNEFIPHSAIGKSLWYSSTLPYTGREINLQIDKTSYKVWLETKRSNLFYCEYNGDCKEINILKFDTNYVKYLINNKLFECWFSRSGAKDYYIMNGCVFELASPGVLRMAGNYLNSKLDSSNDDCKQILSPLFGKIININVQKRDKVRKGDVLITIESMKTENNILAPGSGIVDSILVKEGNQVKENVELLTLSPIN